MMITPWRSGLKPRAVATATRLALPPIQVALSVATAFQASAGSQGRRMTKPSVAPAMIPITPAAITRSAVRPSRAMALTSDDSSISVSEAGSR
jgi:hypothetical protein